MKTFPIEFPDATAPASPLVRVARTLGVHPYAVALATLGWPAVCRSYHRETSRGPGLTNTWFIGSHPEQPDLKLEAASKLIDLLPVTGEKALPAAHPIHAAIAALANLAGIMDWMQRGGPVPGVTQRGEFLVLSDTPTVFPAAEPVEGGARDVAFLAAAITVGFVPFPALVNGAIAFPATSRLRPELTLRDCAAALQPQAIALRSLPGAPPEEHAFFYALQAVRNVAPMLQAQAAAQKNPICEKQNPYVTQYRALVSNALLEGTDALSRRVKAALHTHLKKTA